MSIDYYSGDDDAGDDDDVVVAEVVGSEEDDDEEVDDENVEEEDDEDEEDDDDEDDAGSFGTDLTPPPADHASSSSKKRTLYDYSEVDYDETTETASAVASAVTVGGEGGSMKKKSKSKRSSIDEPPKLHQGLTIPFRTIKRIMKTDRAVGNIQNDAAIMVTAALEHFVKEIALKSLEAAKQKRDGTNIVKYEDVATARANNSAFSFLDLLIP